LLSENDRGDGGCRHLKYRLCGIYDKRPVICDTEMNMERYKYIYCTDCGERLKETALFCTECGKNITKTGQK
jgi:DNA-directed RNA polymerase subunit RPC12/RpoP